MAPFFFTTSSAIPHPSRSTPPPQGETVKKLRSFSDAPFLRVAPPRRAALLGPAARGDEIAYALATLAPDLLVELAAPLRLHCQPALPTTDEAALPTGLAHRHPAELGLAQRAPSRRPPCRHLQFRCRATAHLPAGPLGFLVGHLVLCPPKRLSPRER